MTGKEYTAKDKIFSMGDILIRGVFKKLIKEHDLPPIVFTASAIHRLPVS